MRLVLIHFSGTFSHHYDYLTGLKYKHYGSKDIQKQHQVEPLIKELSRDSMKCPVCSIDYETRDLIRINPIHPDHRKAAKELFEKRRKRAAMKAKLQRKMKKVIFF